MQKNMIERTVKKVWKSQPTIEGAGVHLKRAFGFHEVPQLDPFLLLDDFRSENPEEFKAGFPWHPHRGIETMTVRVGEIRRAADAMSWARENTELLWSEWARLNRKVERD